VAELLLDSLKMVLQQEIDDLPRNLQEKKHKSGSRNAGDDATHRPFCRE
jgi:hypothetical protein